MTDLNINDLLDLGGMGVAFIALVILYLQTRKNQQFGSDLEEIKDNHLHEVKTVLDELNKKSDCQTEILHDIKETLIRMETKMNGKKR
jgi:hypothetical protein